MNASAPFLTQYHQEAQTLLSRILDSQSEALRRGAERIAATIERDGLIYCYGSGHSVIPALELYFRAGGMARFDLIYDPAFGRAERLPGYARTLWDRYPVSARDLLIVVSNSGRNAAPVEMALLARERGVGTVAITSLAHSSASSSRAPGGQRLFEICDVVIDSGVPAGDAAVPLAPESPLRMGPLSSLACVFVVNCLSGMAAGLLRERGVEPPVFLSANVDGSDEHNQRLFEFMRQRIRGV